VCVPHQLKINIMQSVLSKNVKKLKTHVGSRWDPTFYMFYMNILYVIRCKNIHTIVKII